MAVYILKRKYRRKIDLFLYCWEGFIHPGDNDRITEVLQLLNPKSRVCSYVGWILGNDIVAQMLFYKGWKEKRWKWRKSYRDLISATRAVTREPGMFFVSFPDTRQKREKHSWFEKLTMLFILLTRSTFSTLQIIKASERESHRSKYQFLFGD